MFFYLNINHTFNSISLPLLRDVLAVENPPRAAAVNVEEAKGVALGPVSSNQEGANRFLVDRRTPELGTAP